MEEREKELAFLGSSLKDLKNFPRDMQQDIGYQLSKVQNGEDPDDWKPVARVGAGVMEIRVRDSQNAYRVLYVAKFSGVVYVLHSFQKTDLKTSQLDIDIGKERYKSIQDK